MTLYSDQGFISFDDIISVSEIWDLSISAVDWLSDKLMHSGVIIREDDNTDIIDEQEQEKVYDYAQVDYEKIYNRVIELAPGLTTFIDEVRRIKPAQKREIQSLQHQAKEGNAYARTRIIEMHLRIAVRVGLQRAEQYDMNVVDCISDACMGLIIGVDKYEPESSGPIASYVSFWIYQYISRNQSSRNPDIYYPVHVREAYYKAYPFLKSMGCTDCPVAHLCSEPKEIIQGVIPDCTSSTIDNVLTQSIPYPNISDYLLNEYEEYDEEAFNIEDEETIDEWVENNYWRDSIPVLLRFLSDREAKIIRLKFGLDGGDPQTLEEIGQGLGCTRERVRQILGKAINKLKMSSCSKKYENLI